MIRHLAWATRSMWQQIKGKNLAEQSWHFINSHLKYQFSSVQSLSRVRLSVTHESQQARPPCPSPTLGVYSTHAHWVGNAIHPSHPLSSPSPPAPNPSQHQGLFQWVNSLQPPGLQHTFLSFTISQNLLKLMSFESMMLSNHLILCHPILFLPSILPTIRVFSNELALCLT